MAQAYRAVGAGPPSGAYSLTDAGGLRVLPRVPPCGRRRDPPEARFRPPSLSAPG